LLKIKKYGKFDIKTFKSKLDGSEHFAITKGKFKFNKSTRVRVISTNIINNIINFNKKLLDSSLKYLSKYNNFALILIKDQNLSSFKMTTDKRKSNNILRYYGIGAQIIKDLKINNMILVSRSKKKIIGLDGYGIKIKKQEIIK
jgi:3,4-dihydroxy 2-butanone 4-phosphate synthase/GTP cyclohydrolase II